MACEEQKGVECSGPDTLLTLLAQIEVGQQVAQLAEEHLEDELGADAALDRRDVRNQQRMHRAVQHHGECVRAACGVCVVQHLHQQTNEIVHRCVPRAEPIHYQLISATETQLLTQSEATATYLHKQGESL